MFSKIKAVLKLLFFLVWTGLLILPQTLIVMCFKGKYSYFIPVLWHRGVCLVFGIRHKVIGKPIQGKQVLYLSNHISYLDIPVIGSVLKASFVAKSEVAGWPIFGVLAKLSGTAFVSRSRQAAKKEKDNLSSHLQKGKSLVLFPEATSTSGADVIPFKPSLLAVMFDEKFKQIPIQPFTIQVTEINGKKDITQEERDLYAWYKEEDELVPHLWTLAQNKGALITLIFDEPNVAENYKDRKELSKACHHVILKNLRYGT